ncbi:hypothetical protein GCK32_005359, partial [Trichostrongylus colubriformis]
GMVCTRRTASKNEDGSSMGAVSEDATMKDVTLSSSRKSTSSRSLRAQSVPLEMDESKDTTGGPSQESGEIIHTTNTPLTTPSRRPRKKRSSVTGQQDDEVSNADMGSEESGSIEQQTASSSSVEGTPSNAKVAATPSKSRRRSASSSMVSPSPARITRAMRKAGVTTPKENTPLEVVQELPAENEVEEISTTETANRTDSPSRKSSQKTLGSDAEQRGSLKATSSLIKEVGTMSGKPHDEAPVVLPEAGSPVKSPLEHAAVMQDYPKKSRGSPQKESPARKATVEDFLEELPPVNRGITEVVTSPVREVVNKKSPRRTPKKQSAEEKSSEGLPLMPSMQTPVEVDDAVEMLSPGEPMGSPQIKSPTSKAVSDLLRKELLPAVEDNFAVEDAGLRESPRSTAEEPEKGSPNKKRKKQTAEEVIHRDSSVGFSEELLSPEQQKASKNVVKSPLKTLADILNNAEESTETIVKSSTSLLESYPITEDSVGFVSTKTSTLDTTPESIRDVDHEQSAAFAKKKSSTAGESTRKGERYVELESFKQLFKRPKFYRKALDSSISSLFAYASKVESRKDDLPSEFLSDDLETVWQFIAHSGKQIIKEFRKRVHLLDIDIQLKDSVTSSEEEESDDEAQDVHDEEEENEDQDDDLLNLNDEDLKDLEREMDEMREEEEQEEAEESNKPRKKYPKSAVDDKFFSLAEMAAFLDEQERTEGTGPSVLDTVDDSETAPADYGYEDFFGRKDTIEKDESANQKERKKKRDVDTKELRKKKKSVRFSMDIEQPEEEDGHEEAVQEDGAEVLEGPVLLGDKEESEEPQTNLKKSLKRLKQTIAKLEQENLAPRSWQLSGEVTAQQREENELLETHVQFDHGAKKAPEITEAFTEKLEDLIKQRIKDKAFDDVVRRKRVEERTEPYRNQAIEEQEIVKTSLAEVYEKEYQKAAGETSAVTTVNEEHVAIEKRMRELFRLIDALSNFDYTPPEVKPEVRVVSNMPALRVEEVGMSASTDAQLLAPEELKKRQKGDLKAAEERDRTDKLRQRRKKKNRQRALVELFGEEKVLENQKRKKKKSFDEKEATDGEKLKSSTFFTKLQETVRNEIKEKTTKKKRKVISEQVSAGGSKYMLQEEMNYTGQYVQQQPSGAMPPMQAQQQAQMMQQQRMRRKEREREVLSMSRFPPHWQQEMHAEQSQERKKQLFTTFVRRFNTMQQQQQSKMVSNGQGPMMHQQMMGQGGVMVGPSGQRAPAGSGLYAQQQQPASVMAPSSGPMSNAGMSGPASAPMPTQQIRMAGHMAGGQGAGPQQMMSASSMNPQSSGHLGSGASPQVHSSFAGHQMAVGSPHMSGVGPAGGMSNSPVTCIQPSTPQNPSSVQPGSVGPGSQQPGSVPSQEENTKEYNDLVESLKEQYYEKLKRIGDRCDLDNSPKPTGFDRLMEILDRKRRVSQSLLEKIVGNVRTIVERSSLTYPVIETMRQIEAEGQSSIFSAGASDDYRTSQPNPPQALLDPWRSVRHLMIKVPEHLANLSNSDDDATADAGAVKSSIASSTLKRPAPSDLNDSGVEAKMEKLDDSAQVEPNSDSCEDENMRIKIDCLFDTRQPWRMSVAASRELSELPWRVDTDCLPASSHSPDAVICFDSDLLLCPPLRVLVPASYPLDPAVIQFDRSFPRGVQISSQLSTMLERSLSVAPSRSLTHIHSAFRSACQELMRLKGVHNGHYIPNKQHKQLVA